MTIADIARWRLQNQRLSAPDFKKPVDVVKSLGAVQAQDYYGAKWAVGQRMCEATDAGIETAFSEGTILRTHVMRPTWHFVAPADIRWMLELTATRVNAAIGSYYRKVGLDDTLFRRTNKALAATLRGGKQLTRAALRDAVERAGVATGTRFGFILVRAELDGVICSGARKDRQFTYALLDERVPAAKRLARDEALAELTRRYFTSHGPATVRDFVWWSGLTTADARAGVDMVQRRLVKEVIDGASYWLPSSATPAAKRASPRAYLLSPYDEYLVAYRDRSAAIDSTLGMWPIGSNPIFSSPIVIDGRVAGKWTRTLTKGTAIISVSPFRAFTSAQRQAVRDAAHRYGAFLGMTVVLA